MGLVLKRLPLDIGTYPIYHIAPEESVAEVLIEKYGDKYIPADFSPEIYSWSKVPVKKIDLSNLRQYVKKSSVGAFVHSHVLEHIPGSIEKTIADMNDSLVPGGFHLFQAPIENGWYREDMNPELSEEERLKQFKQEDHLRMFGSNDFEDRVLRLFKAGFDLYDIKTIINQDDLTRSAVPSNAINCYTGHSVFLFTKKMRRRPVN